MSDRAAFLLTALIAALFVAAWCLASVLLPGAWSSP